MNAGVGPLKIILLDMNEIEEIDRNAGGIILWTKRIFHIHCLKAKCGDMEFLWRFNVFSSFYLLVIFLKYELVNCLYY